MERELNITLEEVKMRNQGNTVWYQGYRIKGDVKNRVIKLNWVDPEISDIGLLALLQFEHFAYWDEIELRPTKSVSLDNRGEIMKYLIDNKDIWFKAEGLGGKFRYSSSNENHLFFQYTYSEGKRIQPMEAIWDYIPGVDITRA